MKVEVKGLTKIYSYGKAVFENLSFALKLARSYPTLPFVLLNYQFAGFEQLAPSNLRGVFNDEFCGGQTELLKEKLLAENVTVDEFCAEDKKDIHCFHLLPFHRTTASCMDKVKSFLKNIYSA